MRHSRASERGGALMMVVIIVVILLGISMAYQSISWWNQKRAQQEEAGIQALYLAESAAHQYINTMNTTVGTPGAVTKTYLHGGYYWVPSENLVDVGNATSTNAGVTSTSDFLSFQVGAKYGGVTRRIDVLMSKSSAGAFSKVLDSENQKGLASQVDFNSGDVIRGNAYIGGNVNAQGTAQLLDASGTTGNVTKYTGSNLSNLTGPNPPSFVQGSENPMDLSPDSNGLSRWENRAAANRNTPKHLDSNGTKYIDVRNEVTTKGGVNKWVDGSTAIDLGKTDPTNPAHAARLCP